MPHLCSRKKSVTINYVVREYLLLCKCFEKKKVTKKVYKWIKNKTVL